MNWYSAQTTEGVCLAPNFVNHLLMLFIYLWCASKKSHFQTSTLLTPSGKFLHVRGEQFAPKSNQATDWPHVNLNRNIWYFNPVSLVWVPPIRRHSQYPCPRFDIAALLNENYTVYILKQRSIGASSEMYLFPAKVGAKYAPGPTQPPKMPNLQQINGLNITSSSYLAFRWGIGGFGLGG